jgi:hypothetical protein
MSDHIHLDKMFPPWSPDAETTSVTVFHFFTIPLVGLVEQHGCFYIYWCVVGHSGPENAWAYARLDNPDDADQLGESDQVTFDEILRHLVEGRVSTFALASDETGITEWVTLEPPASFDDAFSRGMSALGIKIKEVLAEMVSIQEQYGSLRAASTFSIAPTPVLS